MGGVMWNNGGDSDKEAIELQDLGGPDPSTLPWDVLPNELWAMIGEENSDLRWNMRNVSPNFNSLFTLSNIAPPPIQPGRSIELIISCGSPTTSLVEYSPDILVSGHEDGRIRVWNINTGLCMNELQDHRFPVKHLAVFNNDWLVSRAADGIRIWDQGGECVKKLQYPAPEACEIHALAASRKSSWLACISSCGNDTFIFAWNCSNPASTPLPLLLSQRLPDSSSSIANIGEDRVAFLNNNLGMSEIIIFNIKTSNAERMLKIPQTGHSEERVKHIAPLGTCYLAIGTEIGMSDDTRSNIYIYNWRTRDLIRKIHSSKGHILSMAAFDHGELVTIHAGKKICIWDCQTGQLRTCREKHNSNLVGKLSNFRFVEAINIRNNYTIRIEHLRTSQAT